MFKPEDWIEEGHVDCEVEDPEDPKPDEAHCECWYEGYYCCTCGRTDE